MASYRLLAAAAAICGAGYAAAQTTRPAGGPVPDPIEAGEGLSALSRVVQRFDFEEAERAPYTMPFNFYRYIAPDQGFPRFGRMHLASDVAKEGRWSFEFELDGGSLSARVPTAVIPVLPGSDYAVTAWVRTDGLNHSAARVTAQLYDAAHQAISASRAESPLLRTGGLWRQVSVEVIGDHPDAADLVIELELLQAEQHAGPREGDRPLLQDVTGRAWFDDVTVRHQPRIEITTSAPGNVVIAPQAVTLSIMVRDPALEPLTAQVRVEDLDGRALRNSTWALPRGAWRRAMKLNDLDPGWYLAVVDVHDRLHRIARRRLSFMVLAPPRPAPAEGRFGVVLDDEGAGAADTQRLLGILGVSSVLMPLPPGADGDRAERPGRELVLSLPVPGPLVEQPETRAARQWIESSEGVEAQLMKYGLGVSRWVISPGSAMHLPERRLTALVNAVAGALGGFVPDPVVLVPWSAEYELPALPPPHGFWIDVPSFVRPDSLASYASRWPLQRGRIYATLQRLDGDRYAPAERVTDLMLRALHGWRSGIPHMAITAPWSRQGPRGELLPEPALGAWRALAECLEGRRFAGRLPAGPGIECWILAGPGPGDAALVAWTAGAASRMDLRLADGPVEVVDAFGNRRPVPVTDGGHDIAVGPRPVFIEGVDARLVSFLADLRVAPSYVTARHQLHEARLTLGNPWPETISGEVRLRPPEGWRLTPRAHAFAIPPGETAVLPLDLIVNQQAITGPAVIEVEIDLVADAERRLRALAEVEIGMQHVEFAAHWRLDGPEGDLVISQQVTNTGDEPLNLVAYVSAPQLPRQRRPIGVVEPGRSATRTFLVPGGARLLAGKDVHVGIIETGGARLNRVLSISAIATDG